MTIELVTTDGIFALDGGEWEVTNNIWLVGDDREVVVFDAAHDARADRRRRQRSPGAGRSCSPTATTTTSTPLSRCATRSTRRYCCTPPTGCCGMSSGPPIQPDRAIEPGDLINVAGHELWACCTRPVTRPVAAASTTPTRACVFSGDTLFCGGPGATGRSYSDEPTIVRSIRDRLLTLPDHTIVHTGHGDSTTIGAERQGVLARAAELGLH